MLPQDGKGWYLYHRVGNEIVMDRAQHALHHAQALQSLGMQRPDYIAATLRPLTATEVAGYESQYGLKLSTASRRELPAFVEPPEWEGIRARNRAAAEKNKAVLKNG